MAYSGTNFITFPNGDVVDVSGCAMTVSGTSLTLARSGVLHYQFKFNSAADAASYTEIISTAISTFNYQPITFFDWSVDGLTWSSGLIPLNAAPLFILFFGQNLNNAATAVLTDSGGRTFTSPVVSTTTTQATAGPFTSIGGSGLNQGNARVILYDVNGIAVASTVVQIGPSEVISWTPSTPTSLVEWLKSDSLAAGSLSTWAAAAGTNATATGSAEPTVIANAQNGLPVVRFDGVANSMHAATFTSSSQPMTLALAFRYNGPLPPASDSFVAFGSPSPSWFLAPSANTPSGNWDLEAAGSVNIGLLDGNFHTLFLVFNGASSKFAFDGRPLALCNPGGNAVNDIYLGSYGPAFFSQIDVGEVIAWDADGTTMYGILSNYLLPKWI